MFQKLQELPLLMGLGVQELMRIVELVNFDFNKYAEGTTFVNQGDRCDRIIYVLGGIVCADRRDEDNNMLISEYIDHCPFAIEPQNQWGMRQKFMHTYTFTTDGSTCSIDKRQLSNLISNFEIVKTNILSLVCNSLQATTAELQQPIPPSTEERLLRLLRVNMLTRTGRKVVRVKMEQLAHMTDDTRLSVSRVLNTWQRRGLIQLRRGGIEIEDAEKLFAREGQEKSGISRK